MRRSTPSIVSELAKPKQRFETVALPGADRLALFLRSLAIQDWLVVAYLIALVAAAVHGSGPTREVSLQRTGGLLGAELCMLVLVRGNLLRSQLASGMLYRVVTYGGVQVSYFILRDLLPVANPRALDAQLTAIDIKIFGVEPTLWVDRFVSSTTTEWFSFFYFGYFFALAAHFWPFLIFGRDARRFNHFTLSAFITFCTAHLVYMLVPGFGPYAHLAGSYQHQLPHGYWYDVVLQAVATGGAQKDIFPSLHTAAPTMIAFYSFRHRRELPFKYTWPFAAFIALNIVGATIFLRWHYAIDVVAGLTLAFCAVLLGERLVDRELLWRGERGIVPVWPPMFSDESRQEPSASRASEPARKAA